MTSFRVRQESWQRIGGASPRRRASQSTLRKALHGRIKRCHRFLLGLRLQQFNALEVAIAEIDQEADAGLACFRAAVKLSSIPGVSELSAQTIVSEIGTDMSRFATSAHLRSWAALCPRNDESAMRLGCDAHEGNIPEHTISFDPAPLGGQKPSVTLSL
jgi:transposase